VERANRLPRLAEASPYNPPVTGPSAPLVRVVRKASRLPPPDEALRRLSRRPHPFLRLVGGPGFRGTPWSFAASDPVETLQAGPRGRTAALERQLAALRPRPIEHHGPAMPFGSGWAGWVGYEARSGVERQPPPRSAPLAFPSIWLGHYDAVLGWNHKTGEAFVGGAGSSRAAALRAADALLARVRKRGHAASNGCTLATPHARSKPAQFRRAVAQARRAVLRGDIFQANVSQRFDARVSGDAVTLFERLVASQPAPYMTYCDGGDGRVVLSASPERFLRLRGRVAETDPMKGTRPRGATRREDAELRAQLDESEKERAELAMIVDLSRNDLSRVCTPGTVRVATQRRLLRFARVHQAIAVVRGRLPPDRDCVDLLAAAFPPGSVTGAPKVRAMEIIDALEGEGRGPYCGALGWFDDGGDMDLAVAIRTILLTGRTASYRVGAGITLRSDPHAEWRETLDKGRGLFAALSGREDDA